MWILSRCVNFKPFIPQRNIIVITDAGVADTWVLWSMASATLCLCVWVCVRALKEKRLELSTANLAHAYPMAWTQHVLALGSKSQRSRSHGYQMRCRHGYAGRYDCPGFQFLLFCCLRVMFRYIVERPLLSVVQFIYFALLTKHR